MKMCGFVGQGIIRIKRPGMPPRISPPAPHRQHSLLCKSRVYTGLGFVGKLQPLP